MAATMPEAKSPRYRAPRAGHSEARLRWSNGPIRGPTGPGGRREERPFEERQPSVGELSALDARAEAAPHGGRVARLVQKGERDTGAVLGRYQRVFAPHAKRRSAVVPGPERTRCTGDLGIWVSG
ncbi:hypothetical protein predicted by Glimmer/Critica [Sorangium cellulosum So ce56]|uniref:Uncharacterized protein n=1 Tax=Sorangium cellulosum (strain So ce56) TaxID=448385 RepID=A9G4M5_SORC5|nr:hypothetical protein predicted by Glimmer/Critica [Sorangium cellulosum So ce56]